MGGWLSRLQAGAPPGSPRVVQGDPGGPPAFSEELPVRRVTAPVRGWRRWRLIWEAGEPFLRSTVVDTVWRGPILRADAKPGVFPDSAPDAGHGIYAWSVGTVLWEALSSGGFLSVTYPPYAEGEVELMGRVIRHEMGYRAESARIVRLFLAGVPGWCDRLELERQLSDRYQCDVGWLPDVGAILGACKPEVPEQGQFPFAGASNISLPGALTHQNLLDASAQFNQNFVQNVFATADPGYSACTTLPLMGI